MSGCVRCGGSWAEDHTACIASANAEDAEESAQSRHEMIIERLDRIIELMEKRQ